MKFNKINTLINNNTELFDLSDCTEFLNDNELKLNQFPTDSLIIFQNLTDDYNKLLSTLNTHNIQFNEYTDHIDLKYIII